MAKKYHFEIPKNNIFRRVVNKTGGGKSIKRINFSEHGTSIVHQTEEFKSTEFQKKDLKYIDDIFLQISTLHDHSLKSQLSKIEPLGFKLVSYSKLNQSIANVKISKDDFESFEEKLDEYINSEDHKYRSYFAAIEKINVIPNETKVSEEIDLQSDEFINVIISFYSGIKSKDIEIVEQLITSELQDISKFYDFQNINDKIVTVLADLRGDQIYLLLQGFNSIKSIELNKNLLITNSVKGNDLKSDVKIESPTSSSAICIIDSGITANGVIMPNLTRNRISSYIPTSSVHQDNSHGTFVASRCIFGDTLESQVLRKRLQPYCYVIDVPVFGINILGNMIGLGEFELMRTIREVVESLYQTIKVYNLSLGFDNSINDYEISNIAKTLDLLSKEYDVIFVVSSGNINNQLGDYPLDHFNNVRSRIGAPAESLLSITVGSIVKFSNSSCLSNENNISPFSKIGPGADLGVKPEVVAHGGNLVSPYDQSIRVSTVGIYADGISLSYDIGTSFSSPLISRYCQMLLDYYPFATSNMVKSLLYHFAKRNNIHNGIDYDMKYTGFGEPNIDNALYAGTSATYLYQGSLDSNNYTFIRFDVPQIFNDASIDTNLKIKVTIVYNPEVDNNNDLEYCSTRISATLIKKVPFGIKEVKSVNSENSYYKQWSPIIQFEKKFKRSFSYGEWFVKLRLYTRGNVSDTYLQDFSIVIEVIDENGNNIYDLIKNDTQLKYNTYEEKVDVNYA